MKKNDSGGWTESISRLVGIVLVAGLGVVLTIIIGFIADIRSEQADMRSRFEERTVQAQANIERISNELERARNTRANIREVFSKQQALVAALSAKDERISNELDRARITRADMREVFSKQQALVVALQAKDERMFANLESLRERVELLAVSLSTVDEGQAKRLDSLQLQINRIFEIMRDSLQIEGARAEGSNSPPYRVMKSR